MPNLESVARIIVQLESDGGDGHDVDARAFINYVDDGGHILTSESIFIQIPVRTMSEVVEHVNAKLKPFQRVVVWDEEVEADGEPLNLFQANELSVDHLRG